MSETTALWVIGFAGLGLLAFLHFKVGPHVDKVVDRWMKRD